MASSPIQSPKRTQPIVAGASPLVLPVTPLHPSTNKTTLPIVVNQPISVPNSPKAYSVTDPRAGILCCPPPELDPGIIEFVYGTYTTYENTPGSASIYVQRINGSDGISYVNYTSSNGTARNPTNYTGSTGTLKWDNGELGIKHFDIKINNIAGWNPDVAFSASLYNAINASLGLDQAVINILNVDIKTPGCLRFTQTTQSVLENVPSASLSVERISGSDDISSVIYVVQNGTAIVGTNYGNTYGSLVWAHGESGSKSFTVPIYNDGVYTPTLYFTASLTSSVNSTLTCGRINEIIYIENANPSLPGTMSFVSSTYSILEPDGNPTLTASISFFLTRSGGMNGVISASCTTSAGSAIAGTDYKSTSSKFVWQDGNAEQKEFVVEVYRNAAVNVNIGFTASLSNPYGGALGTVSKSIATIINVGDAGIIKFVDASYITYENSDFMVFEITRSGGTTGKVTASFTTIDGSAISGSIGVGDYIGRALPLMWDTGDGTKRYVSIIIDGEDGVIEPDKYFSGSLSNPIGGAVLGLSQSTVTIIDTTTIVQYVDNLFVGVNGAQSTQTHLELLGYTGSTVTIDITSQAGDVFYATPPAKGIEAVGQVFTPNTNTFTWTPAEGNATKTEWTVSYASAWKDPNVEPESYICSRSITSWTNCVTGSNDKANVYLYNFDDEADMVLNVIRLQEPLETLQIDLYGTTSTTVYAENFNGVNVKSTASYTTVNGTAIAGTDYKTVSGVVMFNTGVLENPVDNFPSAAIDLEIYPTCAGKYFYVQLSSPIPFTGTSIAYPSKVMITGSWDVSHVTFRESSITQLATSQFETGVPFNIEIDRTDNLTDAISIVATIHDDYNTDTFFYPNGSYSNTLSWMAGEGGIKILTVNGASVNSMLENGYFTMSLYKVNPTDKVIFSPTSSLYITYEVP